MTFDRNKVLSIAVTVLAITGTLLSAIVTKNERETLKSELLEELLNTTKES